MLLSAVKATNSRGSVLNLPLGDISGGYAVKNIDGLDPVKATLVSSSFANQDGEQYHSSRRESRNIKLTLGLEPDYATQDVKALRDQLYSFFMPKSEVKLTFTLFDRFDTSVLTNTLNVDISGHIETCAGSPFTKDPAMDISIMCYDPDFVDENLVTLNGYSVADGTETIFTYDGSVDTGVVFQLRPDRAINEFTIYHRPPDQSLRTTDLSYALQAGDVLEISSVKGNKYATLTRAGVQTSILYSISPQSNWLELQPGDNSLRVYVTGSAIPYTITYNNKYGGL